LIRIAALIFALTGSAYLAWDVVLTLRHGFGSGTWLMALFAWAMLYEAYALFRARKGARWTALAGAVILSLSSGYLAILVAEPPLPQGLSSIPVGHWPMFVTLLAVAAAFGSAAVLLVFARPPRPDPPIDSAVAPAGSRSDVEPPAT
jgi:hypothetical protein